MMDTDRRLPITPRITAKNSTFSHKRYLEKKCSPRVNLCFRLGIQFTLFQKLKTLTRFISTTICMTSRTHRRGKETETKTRFLVKTRKWLSFWNHQRKCHNYKDWWCVSSETNAMWSCERCEAKWSRHEATERNWMEKNSIPPKSLIKIHHCRNGSSIIMWYIQLCFVWIRKSI